MRVCQFRHFGTGLASGGFHQIGSKIKFRKSRGGCQTGVARRMRFQHKMSLKAQDEPEGGFFGGA